jgi:hypothetical protein
MFQDLDTAIESILNLGDAPAQLLAADVSFETPDRNYAPTTPTVNLFLFEVKEDRELRDPEPIVDKVGDVFIRRLPPLRIDCTYLVTAWSNLTLAARVVEEHRLLGQALLWLSRFPTIPANFLVGTLAGQPFPPPTMVAQVMGEKNSGDFWAALGAPPRPAFYLMVTIAMDLNRLVEGPLVTTTTTAYQQGEDASTRAERINMGGIVRNATGAGVADAWVRLEPAGRIEVTLNDGRFVFVDVRQGTNLTLRARAAGLGEVSRTIDIPSQTGEYNLQFP